MEAPAAPDDPAAGPPGEDGGAVAPPPVHDVRLGAPAVLFFVDNLTAPECTTRIALFAEQVDAFHDAGASLLGVVHADHAEVAAYLGVHGLRVRLLADPEGDVARILGATGRADVTLVLVEASARAAFIADRGTRQQAEAALALVRADGAGGAS